MVGTILCNKCRRKMDGVCKCGNYKCLVYLYWKGEKHSFRRDEQGYVFTYPRAVARLVAINAAIQNKTFNPVDFSDKKVQERRFENMMERWLEQKAEEAQANELSSETLKIYRSNNRKYFEYFLGWDVREIRFEQLESFKDSLPTRLSLKTRRNILHALHTFFTWLWKKGVIQAIPPWPEIKGDDARKMRALDREDQDKALERIPQEHRDLFILMCETGARVNEVCALKVKDIDFKNGVWTVQRTYSGKKLRETTKAKNKLPIPLSDKALEVARQHAAGKFKEDFLFINRKTKGSYRYKVLNNLWNKFAKAGVSLYEATRHSFCTQIVESGVSTLVAQLLMRHADVKSTKNYFHANIVKFREVVNNRGKVIPLRSEKIEVK